MKNFSLSLFAAASALSFFAAAAPVPGPPAPPGPDPSPGHDDDLILDPNGPTPKHKPTEVQNGWDRVVKNPQQGPGQPDKDGGGGGGGGQPDENPGPHWLAYTTKNFKSEPITPKESFGKCQEITDPKLLKTLLSAKADGNTNVELSVDTGCKEPKLCVDGDGWGDLTNRPEYRSFKILNRPKCPARL